MVVKKNKDSDVSKIFGEIFKDLIKHHSISFRKLSKHVGVTRTHLMGLASGKYSNPKLNTVDRIAKFFKVSHAQLVGEQKIGFKTRSKKLDFGCEE